MRASLAGCLLLCLLPLCGRSAGVQAAVPRAAAAAQAPSAPDAAALPVPTRPGMPYRHFVQRAGARGWQVVDPLAADSCVAAGDCEIELIGPRSGDRLRVRIGSQAGLAVVLAWRPLPAAASPGSLAVDPGAVADDGPR